MTEDAFYVRRVWSFSRALDLALVDEEFGESFKIALGERHGERVSYIAVCIGRQLGLPKRALADLAVAGLLHDIGAVGSFRQFHGDPRLIEEHCLLGPMTVESFPSGEVLADAIRYHHEAPDPQYAALKVPLEQIPLLARIISFADKVDAHLLRKAYNREEREKIIHWVHQMKGKLFFPELIPEFTYIAEREAFWLDLMQSDLIQIIIGLVFDHWIMPSEPYSRGSEEARFADELASTFADLIDQKSQYTMRHSRSVAENAMLIAAKLGWDRDQQHDIFMAGLVHDLGKLAVPTKILDKPGPLNREEADVIRTHTYYTHRLLTEAGFPPQIVNWAAHHHEQLDGGGYPFRLKSAKLDVGSRLMTIADIFSALTEDRPYRKALSREEALGLIRQGAGISVDPTLLAVAEQVL